MRLILLLALALASLYHAPIYAQATPCRPGIRWLFRPQEMCAEEILSGLDPQGVASIGALTFGPGGALYFTRPAARQVMRMMPDSSGFFTPPVPFLTDLPEPPVGLAYDPQENVWYVSGDTLIMRAQDGEPPAARIIVRGLPGGAGGWLGNVRIGPDRRLYVAKAASCEACAESDPRRAALLSFALDGSDMQIVARGLRSAFDFAWRPETGHLYIVDDERPTLRAELNVIAPGAAPDFGWPACDSSGQPISAGGAPRCAAAARPALTFDPASRPMGMVYYDGEAFPALRGGLLIALSGSWNAPTIGGYEIAFVPLDSEGKPGAAGRFLPDSPLSASDAALLRASFYPYHLIGLAVSAEGWIYASAAEGRIYRFRPYEQ